MKMGLGGRFVGGIMKHLFPDLSEYWDLVINTSFSSGYLPFKCNFTKAVEF